MMHRAWRRRGRVELEGILFNPGAPLRVLALHGWLDNAMSFAPLAECLPDWEILALDFAGHGRSGHLPAGSWYHFVDYLDDVATALAGRPVELLLGHSLGGAVATAWAAARPETVPRLALIEALGPLAGQAEQAVASLRRALDERQHLAAKRLRRFDGIEQAVEARLGAGRIGRAAARLLVERGLRQQGDGWVWSSDPRLTLTTPLRPAEETVRQWIAAIEAPTLVVAADHPPAYFDPALRAARMAQLRRGQLVVLPGHHHLHMDQPGPVAAVLARFLGATPPSH